LTATVENAMGIRIDGSIVIDRAGLGSLLQRAGGAEIDIPDRLIDRQADGTGTVAFDQGPQFLNGLRLAEYWAFDQRGETELDSFPRQQRALDAMFRALDDQSLLDTMFNDVPAELDTGIPAGELRQVIGTMAAAAVDGVVEYQLLPVVPFGSADETLGASYQMRAEDVASLVANQFAGAVPEGGVSTTLALQVLNGVGVPGIGQQVDLALRGLDVRIVRTDNARSFDFPTTRIVIYQESAEVMRVARQVQQAMGVGTIQISRQPQSVVDMTLVVGGDFLGQDTGVSAGL
jgi:anionic cell wall polymer biosynthesis LytR-Cps2A-Psr (LCP) family protein